MGNYRSLARAAKPSHMMANMQRWKFSVLAAAAAASVGLYAPDASALALGRINVQSALGEPLRAEVELPEITTAEVETLQATTASPDVFRSQGMEYSQSLNGLQYKVVKKPNGSAVLKISSDRPVNEPFVDLVLDASWGSGRIVRSYTLLLDPPTLRKPVPSVTSAPKVTAPSSNPPAAVATSKPLSVRPSSSSTTASTSSTIAKPTSTASAAGSGSGSDSVKVKAGDTASRIANTHRSTNVSLDQMLVAMLRANPEAFINNNVNRIKAGAVIQLPNESIAASIPPNEAKQIVATQSKDFNSFRRSLASSVPETSVKTSDRTASGTVQAQVEDKTTTNTAPDKLTVTKATLQGTKAAEDSVAKDRQAAEAASRMSELSKNISDLNKLGAATPPANTPPPSTAGSTTTAAAPAVTVATTAPTPPTTTPEAVVTPAEPTVTDTQPSTPPVATETQSDAPPADTPVVPPAETAQQPTEPQSEEPSMMGSLLENPLVPIGGLAALLLLGFGAFRLSKGRKSNLSGDSSFLESRIQQDSFFGASGGQRIDTSNSDLNTGSSMAYSPSQLDAGGDVDPVAEADVYLAYNRDLQAEEILKEAIRHTPSRISAHVKLAEIYAKRQDRAAFEVVASEVFKLTQGEGSDWQRIVDLGSALDPANPLYQPGGQPAAPAPTEPAALGGAFPTVASLASTDNDNGQDLDLDLDLNLHDDALTEAPPVITPPAAKASNDFLDTPPSSMDNSLDAIDLDLPTEELNAPSSGPAPLVDEATTKADALEFDLGGLSLDLDVPSAHGEISKLPTEDRNAMPDDPLATKLALAEEFKTIGDIEGARTYFEEVIAEASGELKEKAQKLLAELG